MNTRRRNLRIVTAFLAAFLLLGLAAGLVLAAETRMLDGKLRAGDTVTVPADETVSGDLYVFAGSVTVIGSVEGDLTVFAGQIQVNGNVGGDLLAAGGTVNVSGDVQGDVRTAGGQATLAGAVGEDLVASGGQTTLASSGTVEGDLIVSGGTISVAGDVTGNIQGTAGTYDRTGTVGGTEIVQLASTDDGEEPAEVAGNRLTDALRHFVVLLIIGALLLWLLPRVVRRPEETLRTEPLLSLGGGLLTWIGFIVFVVALFLIVVLLAIMLGLLQLGVLAVVEAVAGILTLGVVSFVFWLAIAFLADIVVGFALVHLVARSDPVQPSRWRDLALLAAGALVVVILTSLPIIGGIAKVLVMLFGLGAIAVAGWRWWRGRPAGVEIAPPSPPVAPATPVPPA